MKTSPALLFLLAIVPWIVSCANRNPEPPTVSKLDKSRYAGEWHEIARLPNFFEKDLVAAKATYAVNPDGTLSVHNQGLKKDGTRTSIRGTARIPDPSEPGKLLVRFERFPASLFAGDYWILDVDSDYSRALVGSPDLKYLWILDKDPYDKSSYDPLIGKAASLGYDTDKLLFNPKRVTE